MPVTILPARNTSSPFASMTGHHAAVRVPEFTAAKRWYTEKLDFRVVHEWPYEDQQLAYLAPPADDYFFLEIAGDGRPGDHHFCLHVASIDDTIAELRRRDVTIVSEPFELAAIQRRLAFFADPWANLIELAEVIAQR